MCPYLEKCGVAMFLRISLPHLRLLSTLRVLPRYCSHFLEEKVLPAAKVVLSLLPLGAPVFHTFPLQTPLDANPISCNSTGWPLWSVKPPVYFDFGCSAIFLDSKYPELWPFSCRNALNLSQREVITDRNGHPVQFLKTFSRKLGQFLWS